MYFSIGFKNQFQMLLIFSQLLSFLVNWDFQDKQKKDQEWNVRVIGFSSTESCEVAEIKTFFFTEKKYDWSLAFSKTQI